MLLIISYEDLAADPKIRSAKPKSSLNTDDAQAVLKFAFELLEDEISSENDIHSVMIISHDEEIKTLDQDDWETGEDTLITLSLDDVPIDDQNNLIDFAKLAKGVDVKVNESLIDNGYVYRAICVDNDDCDYVVNLTSYGRYIIRAYLRGQNV